MVDYFKLYFRFETNDKEFLPENFPIFIVNHDEEYAFYGFPNAGNGILI